VSPPRASYIRGAAKPGKIRRVTEGRRRSRIGRPYRRLRRWARHTPNGDIAVTLISLGIALIMVAMIIAIAA